MRVAKKVLFVLLVINLFVVLVNGHIVLADYVSDMESKASKFIDQGKTNAGGLGDVTTSITTEFTGLGQILTMVGAGVMVAATSYMGIKYMISPPDKQAALKQQLVGLVVSGIVIFGAYGIWKAIIGVVQNFD